MARASASNHLLTSSIFPFLLLLSLTSLILLSEAGTIIYRLGILYPGDSLKDGDLQLTLQNDCNLVLTDGGKSIWSTNTKAPVCYCTLEKSGELVLYDGLRKRLWGSGKTGPQGDYAVLLQRKTKNLAILAPIMWSTNTRSPTLWLTEEEVIGSENVLNSGEILYPGESLKNGILELKMQRDCNFVLYENGNKVIWASNTANKAQACFVSLQNNGELAVFNGLNGGRLWTSTVKKAGSNFALILQNNRNVGVYGPGFWYADTKKVGTDSHFFPTNTTIPLLSQVATT